MNTALHTTQEKQLACQITTSHGHEFPRAMFVRLQDAGFSPVWGETVAVNNGHVVNLYLPKDEMPRLQALQRQTPSQWGEVLDQDARQEGRSTLANDLSRIAQGEMYSEKAVKAAIEQLETLRQRGSLDPDITPERVDQALVACKLAVHGVREAHHKLQDAAVLIAALDEMRAGHKMPPADPIDPQWREQLDGLKRVTDSIKAAYAPEAIKADFSPAKLRELAADTDFQFDGNVSTPEDRSFEARFHRDSGDGLVYSITLKASPGATTVMSHASISKGDAVLAESDPMLRGSVIGAVDAAIATIDRLRDAMPVNHATTQAEAKLLAQRANAEARPSWLDGGLEALALAREDGPLEGHAPVEGCLVGPDEEHGLPIKTDLVFADAPGEVGAAWVFLCEEENRLAGYLSSLEEGTAVVRDGDAWYLEMDEGQQLVLMHGEVVDGKIKNASSRFDFDLGWVDIEAEEVAAYTSRVSSVADDFMIDRALWMTMQVDHCDSPTPGM